MSKPLSKKALVRANWIRGLRENGDKQCRGVYRVVEGINMRTRYCATGLLLEQLDIYKNICSDWAEYGQRESGLSHEQWCRILQMNDAGKTFNEIANYIEGLPL